ncbi:hypothetical protein B0T09DRAFT_97431 [Sordaria sp. MPI-SDFR-AT-0083]|nr:hypothetical protein B0T09DRAFT_97431 [Sordaria sp. MPI-SDFR-AT-0083]
MHSRGGHWRLLELFALSLCITAHIHRYPAYPYKHRPGGRSTSSSFQTLVLEWSQPHLFQPGEVWRSRFMPARLEEVEVRPGVRLTWTTSASSSSTLKPYWHVLDTCHRYSQTQFPPCIHTSLYPRKLS